MPRHFAVQGFSWLLLALACAGPATAADDNKAGKEQARRLQQAQQATRALEREKLQLLQEKSAFEGALKEGHDKLEQARHGADAANRARVALTRELKAVQAERDALVARLSASEEQLAATQKQLAEQRQALRLAQENGRNTDGVLVQRSQALASCEDKNGTLHRHALELLDKYEKKSCGSAVLQLEPFTQLKRVEMENFVEGFRDKMELLTVR